MENNERVKTLYRHFKATLEKKNINPRELLEKMTKEAEEKAAEAAEAAEAQQAAKAEAAK